MLVLTRKMQERIQIGDNITITILRVKGRTVRVGIEAPKNVRVMRPEILAIEANQPESEVAENANADSPADERSLPVNTSHETKVRSPLPEASRMPSAAPLSLHISRRFRIISPNAKPAHTNATVATAAVAAS